MRGRLAMSVVSMAFALAACGGLDPGARPDGGGDGGPDGGPPPVLAINEVMSNDEGGTTVDEQGEIEDWIELRNNSAEELLLSSFTLTDGSGRTVTLPPLRIAAGEVTLLWADESPDQGARHLPFKISAAGDRITLRDLAGARLDEVVVPPLGLDEAYARLPNGTGAFVPCRYATPGRANGQGCAPPRPPDPPPTIEFMPYTWPPPPSAPGPLAIAEVALFPARFVEVINVSAETIDLGGFALRVAPFAPGVALPGAGEGAAVAWPAPVATLAPGARLAVPVDEAAQGALGDGAEREGVVTLFRSADGAALDRVDFLRWPEGAVLARRTLPGGELAERFELCGNASPGAPAADCLAASARPAGDRLHHIRTPADYAGLAEGGTELESVSVKFVVDMQAGDTVHFLGTRQWPLHYAFIRERIYGQRHLDRCDPAQNAEFVNGWIDFSWNEYFQVDRRFLLGTLVRWGGSGLGTVEFAVGDVITAEQMRRAFFAVTRRLPDPEAWAIRPQADDQLARIQAVDGQVPIVDPNAPFRGRTFQPLVAAVGYGVLRFVPGAELARAALGRDVIVVTDEVPNDIPLIGGLITEAFQTPLAHVAVLSKNRGTPNMALLEARSDARVAPFLNQLVRFEVSGGAFDIRAATPAEATAFWAMQWPERPPVAPRLDTSVRDLIDLADRSLDDLPVVGAKAAQIGELYRLAASGVDCAVGLPLPAGAFAVPLVHSLEHFAASGAADLLAARRADPTFRADPAVRAAGLAEIRAAILAHPASPALVSALRDEISRRFGTARVRLRSSSNTEDLPGFSGAGLYTSVSVAIGDPERDVETGLKTVWSSLWTPRAYDERELGAVDHASTAMAVLVHEAFRTERANGVAISRNVLDPIYGDAYYFNAQAGEASVTNPAPGVSSEEGLFQLGTYRITYSGQSSLAPHPVVSAPELSGLMCALGAIHHHFKSRIDPRNENRWFAVDIEWKLLGPERRLLIKQARPYSFGRAAVPTDCREF